MEEGAEKKDGGHGVGCGSIINIVNALFGNGMK
ncbi:hypothetical protein SAMN05216233_10444 [Desulfoluna spongiiphila]|uniref:Uncharacterized protein n=1 Tax=Desulfoluna spongiiphila TaxID=419481 RepID=A0A1G5D8Q3_9BACT|nr:hypothetical protein SAMN05216233_10444 [Desulfoluna spongiiphila]